MRLWDYLKGEMLKNPWQTVCEGDLSMTYEELVIRSEQFAQKLFGERCCAIFCRSEMAAAVALLGCFAAGVTAVPLSVRYGKIHCDKILSCISPTAMITDECSELQVRHMPECRYVEPPVHPALIMCTSGTTGVPKGAMLTENNILTNTSDICHYFEIGWGDSILISRPLYHCAVLTGELLTALIKGVKIRFCSETFNPKRLLNMIEDYQITVFGGTPTMLGMMAAARSLKSTHSLQTVCVSGECMSTDVGKRIAEAFRGSKIYHVYGLTEACPRVSYLPPRLFDEHADSVGIPLDAVSIKILKPDGTMAATNEEGILWVKGDNVMVGYYNAPELTAKVLRDGWLCTGDIGVIDSDGLLKIKGRRDDLIIRAGMNIYPQEIESTLKSDPRVREVLAYKIEHAKFGVQIGLKIVGEFANVGEVKRLCTAMLPPFQIPSVIQLMDELPKNGSGKIIRR